MLELSPGATRAHLYAAVEAFDFILSLKKTEVLNNNGKIQYHMNTFISKCYAYI